MQLYLLIESDAITFLAAVLFSYFILSRRLRKEKTVKTSDDGNNIKQKQSENKMENNNVDINSQIPANNEKTISDEDIKRELENEILRKKEIEEIQKKLTEHYSILRKAARDMLSSLKSPPEIRGPHIDHVPIPLIEKNNLWKDLCENHMSMEGRNPEKIWENYVDLINTYSNNVPQAFRSIQEFLFSGIKIKNHGESHEQNEDVYMVNGLSQLLTNLIIKRKITISYNEVKRGRKGKSKEILIDGDRLCVINEISANEIMERLELMVEGKNLPQSIINMQKMNEQLHDMKKRIEEYLNWFIFENSNMTECEVVKNEIGK
ncbi:hypothetical protein [Caldiplasma sukawensis]